MELEVKKEHKHLPILITVLVMLLVTMGAVVGVWYYMDQQAKKTAEENKKQTEESQKQIEESGNVKPTTAITNTENIYSNTKGKYSFDLPQGDSVSEGFYSCEGLCGQSVSIIKKQTSVAYKDLFITVRYYINPRGTTLNEVLNQNENYENGNATNIRNITIGGVTGKGFNTPGMGGESQYYYFINNKIVYTIEFADFSAEGQDTALQEILKTFKFN